MQLEWIFEDQVPPDRALAAGETIYEKVGSGEGAPAVLYGASLDGDALAVGRYQRLADAIDSAAVREAGIDLLERTTGGPAAYAGTGILYLALCLRHASVLMECPREKVLNRNLRGLLGGLGKIGVAAHYFGRSWLSVDKRPVALVAWTRSADGEVLVETFLSVTTRFVPNAPLIAYPPVDEDPYGGKEPITLAEAMETVPSAEEIVRAMAQGHAERFEGVTVERRSVDDAERDIVTEETGSFAIVDPGVDVLVWSKPHPIPIGFVSAGVSLAEDGTFADVELAGDFYQDDDAPAAIKKRLKGKRPERDVVARALDKVYGSGRRSMEGIKGYDALVAAILEAAAR